jgi:hypothetical protein
MPAVPVKYGLLKAKHPQYCEQYWHDLRALYAGGREMLCDDAVMERLFPKHDGETADSYAERRRRAFYVNHLGTLIDLIVAGLSTDPARIEAKDGKKPDEWWKEFSKDVSPPRGITQTFNSLMSELMRTALLLGRSWALIDLPRMATAATSLADQQATGALDAYAAEVRPESVLDWECDESGELTLAVHFQSQRVRKNIQSVRNVQREIYTVYTRDSWTRYVVDRTDGQPGKGNDDLIEPQEHGDHTFGEVPLLMHEFPAALWLGNKVYALAADYMNKSCGLSFSEFRSLNQQLYEFLGPEMPGIDTPISSAQQDSGRARKRRSGLGIVQERGADDRAEFIGPSTAGYTHALESLKQREDSIYSTTYQAALSQDTSGAMIRRSAESKSMDAQSTSIVLEAIGEKECDFANRIIERVALARGDEPVYECCGLEEFEVGELSSYIDTAVAVDSMDIPSATYQIARKRRLAIADLGDDATPEVIAAIDNELKQAITQDQLTSVSAFPPQPATGDASATKETSATI